MSPTTVTVRDTSCSDTDASAGAKNVVIPSDTSTEDIVQLGRLAPRLRMLSHRACLLGHRILKDLDSSAGKQPGVIVTDRDSKYASLSDLATVTAEFSKIVRAFEKGDASLGVGPIRLTRCLEILHQGATPLWPVLDQYRTLGAVLATRFSAEKATASETLDALTALTMGPLREGVEKLIDVLQDEMQQRLRSQERHIRSCLDDLDHVNKAIQMIVFNVKIEAARAGEAGRTFSAIADEVRHLAGQTAELADTLRSLTNGKRA